VIARDKEEQGKLSQELFHSGRTRKPFNVTSEVILMFSSRATA
jgi:hypothetical protein